MNEQILEIAKQAQKVAYYTDGGYTPIMTLDQEKFAKLIVRECARKIEEMIDNGWYADTEQLKKHFGVEESSVDEQLRNRSTYFGNDI